MPGPPTLSHVEKHAEYYLPGGDLHLMVDNTLFRVHSFFFERDSSRFRDKLVVPATSSEGRKGSEESPICVLDTTAEDFASFLWTFYNVKYDTYIATVSKWTTILKIARDLDFVEVKAFAIRGLQGCTIDLAERVGIYQKYTADITYLIPLFAELCVRDEGPTDEESEKMGAKTSLMIFRVRERLRCGSTGSVDLAAAIEAISAAVGYNTNASATTSSGGSNPDTTTSTGSGDARKSKHASGSKTNGHEKDSQSHSTGEVNGVTDKKNKKKYGENNGYAGSIWDKT